MKPVRRGPMGAPIRVLLVDDHRLFVDALALLLGAEPDIVVLGAVGTAEEAAEICRTKMPHVVLMDLDLPGKDGIEGTRQIAELSPETRVVVVSALQKPELIARALEAGACGFVHKSRASDELIAIIHRAVSGEIVVPESEMMSVLSQINSRRQTQQRVAEDLTEREVEILQELATGRSTGEIAEQLFISPLTVQSHIKSILSKLGVHSKLEAVTFSLQHGIIRIPQSA